MNSEISKIKLNLSSKQLHVLKYEFDKDKRAVGIAYLLLFFLGWLGIHRVYLHKKGWLYITLWVAFLWPLFEPSLPRISAFALIFGLIIWIVDWVSLHKYVDEYNDDLELRILINLTEGSDNKFLECYKNNLNSPDEYYHIGNNPPEHIEKPKVKRHKSNIPNILFKKVNTIGLYISDTFNNFFILYKGKSKTVQVGSIFILLFALFITIFLIKNFRLIDDYFRLIF